MLAKPLEGIADAGSAAMLMSLMGLRCNSDYPLPLEILSMSYDIFLLCRNTPLDEIFYTIGQYVT